MLRRLEYLGFILKWFILNFFMLFVGDTREFFFGFYFENLLGFLIVKFIKVWRFFFKEGFLGGFSF